MRHDRGASGPMMECTAAVLSLAVAWPFGLSVAGAQSMMRSPSLNIG
ncbi:MAG: Peptidase, partial [Rhizobium sp.]|nr:Peptidase [Rhizobium sp.]